MWNRIPENEAYTEAYHPYFSEFLGSVDIEGIIDNACNLMKDYVAKAPTAFYSYEEFELGAKTIRQFCALRSESISMQLENGETTTNMTYVDASAITLSDMGSMGGGAMPGLPDSKGDFNGSPSSSDGAFVRRETIPENSNAQISGASVGSSDNTMPDELPGEMPDGFDVSCLSDDFGLSHHMQGDFGGKFPIQPSGDGNGDIPSGNAEGNGENGGNRPDSGNMQIPDRDFSCDINKWK